MSDITGRHAVLAEESLFERENAEQRVDDPPHCLHPSAPPRPYLRRDQIDHRNTLAFEPGGDPEVEIRRIGQNREGRFAGDTFRDQLPVAHPDAGKVAQYFDQADDGEVFGPDDGFHPSGTEIGTRAAEKPATGPFPMQVIEQFGGVVIPGGFPGRNKDGLRRSRQPSE